MKTITEFLSTKVAQTKIKATDETIKKIVKDELDRLGHDADLNHIDVSEVTNMYDLFSCDYGGGLGLKYENLNPDISRWDVSQVVDVRFMFYKCKNFNQDLSEWNVNNIENMSGMFWGCENFNQDLSKWDVRNVKDMVEMFKKCKNFNQDISKWNVNKVKVMDHIFDDCPIKEEFKPKFKN